MVEGVWEPGQNCTIVEDVVTSGKEQLITLSIQYFLPDSIQLFIEDQAFLRSYGSTPPTPPVSNLSLFLSLPVHRRLLGCGGGGWARSRTQRPRESLVSSHHSILSALYNLFFGIYYFVFRQPVLKSQKGVTK